MQSNAGIPRPPHPKFSTVGYFSFAANIILFIVVSRWAWQAPISESLVRLAAIVLIAMAAGYLHGAGKLLHSLSGAVGVRSAWLRPASQGVAAMVGALTVASSVLGYKPVPTFLIMVATVWLSQLRAALKNRPMRSAPVFYGLFFSSITAIFFLWSRPVEGFLNALFLGPAFLSVTPQPKMLHLVRASA